MNWELGTSLYYRPEDKNYYVCKLPFLLSAQYEAIRVPCGRDLKDSWAAEIRISRFSSIISTHPTKEQAQRACENHLQAMFQGITEFTNRK